MGYIMWPKSDRMHDGAGLTAYRRAQVQKSPLPRSGPVIPHGWTGGHATGPAQPSPNRGAGRCGGVFCAGRFAMAGSISGLGCLPLLPSHVCRPPFHLPRAPVGRGGVGGRVCPAVPPRPPAGGPSLVGGVLAAWSLGCHRCPWRAWPGCVVAPVCELLVLWVLCKCMHSFKTLSTLDAAPQCSDAGRRHNVRMWTRSG